MKSLLSKIDLGKLWIYVFLLFFFFVPFNLVSEGFRWTVVFLAVIVFAVYKLNIPKFPILLFGMAFAVRLAVVLILKTPPESDFAALLDASRCLLEGEREFLDSLYFQLWTYQLGFVCFQSLLLSIWNSMVFLKLFNCVFAALTTVLIYLLAKEFVCEKASRLISVIYCFLPFPLTYVTVLSNQFSASFLIYLGIYIVISKRIHLKSIFRYLIFAISLVFANVLRPESIIPLFGALIFMVLTVNKTNFKQQLLNIGVMITAYFVLFSLISSLFNLTGLSDNGLSNNASYWKFVLGFNHESGGEYADSDAIFLLNEQAAWEVVKERIFVPIPQLFELFGEKITNFWSGGSLHWSFAYCLKSGISLFGINFRVADDYEIISEMNNWIVLIMNLLIIFGVYRFSRNKNFDKRLIFIVNQVFVSFGVYLLIEVQARYCYYVQIAVFILAALGVDEIIRIIRRLKESKKEIENL